MNLFDDFKEYYRNFDSHPLDKLSDFYADNVVFSDPIHCVEGLANIKRYFSQMCEGLESCTFEFTGEIVAGDNACLRWIMHYRHPKIKQGRSLQLEGVSYLTFNESDTGIRITSHKDFYDMGGMLYEHLPILGSAIRCLKQRLIN